MATLRRAAIVSLAALLLALGVLIWRLSAGPVSMPALLPYMESALDPVGPQRIEIGGVRIGWKVWSEGGLAPVQVLLLRVRLLGVEGEELARLPEARLALAPLPLVTGRAVPRKVSLHEPILRLDLQAEGLGLARTRGDGDAGPELRELTRVAIQNGRVEFVQEAGPPLALRNVALDLARGPVGALTGQAEAELAAGDETTQLRLTVEGQAGALRLELLAPQLPAGALARALHPSFAESSTGSEARADLVVRAVLDGEFMPRTAEATLEVGETALPLGEVGHLPIAGLRAEVAAEGSGLRLRSLMLRLPPGPGAEAGPTLTAGGTAQLTDGAWHAELEIGLEQLHLAGLGTWWPEGLAPAARDRALQNLLAGEIRDGTWHLSLVAANDLSEFRLEDLSGQAQLTNVGLRWHPGALPLNGVFGTVIFSREAVVLAGAEGHQAGTDIHLEAVRLRLADPGSEGLRAAVSGRIVGSVSDAWALLRDPQLELLLPGAPSASKPSGSFSTEITATFPLTRGDPAQPVEAEAEVAFAAGGEPMPVRVTAHGTLERLRVSLAAPRLDPAVIQRVLAPLGALPTFEGEVALALDATLGPDFVPLVAEGVIEAGPGTLHPEGAGPVRFSALRLEVGAEGRAMHLRKFMVSLAPSATEAETGPIITAQGQARLLSGAWRATADLELDRAPLAALETWWPTGLAPAARSWVAENLVGGVVRNGRWRLVGTAKDELSDARLVSLEGQATLEEVGIRWHPALRPVRGLFGTARFETEAIVVIASGGQQEGSGLRLPEARLRLTGLGAGPTRAEISGRAVGPVSDLWALLREPRLRLLEGRSLPIRNPTGSIAAEIRATVPLAGPSAARDPSYNVSARVTDLRLPDVALGRGLHDGNFEVTVDGDGVKAEGRAHLGDISLRGNLALAFAGPGPALQITATTRVAAARMTEFGLDPGSMLEGPVGLTLHYNGGDGSDRLGIRADLSAAEIALPQIGYAKPSGTAAAADASLVLEDGGIGSIESASLDAPGLHIRGRAPEGLDGPIEVEEARFGETHLSATLEQQAEGWRVALRGASLDLRPFLGGGGGGAGGGSGSSLPPVELEARFDQVLVPNDFGPLHEVTAQASFAAGGDLRSARVNSGGSGGLSAAVAPRPGGGWAIEAQATDAGAALAAFGLGVRVEGGQLNLSAVQEGGPGGPIVGTAELENFALRDAPAGAKLLQAITVFGLLDALSGPGLNFAQLHLPFRYAGGVIDIGEARAFSASLGITATGQVNLNENVLDLRGTIVPAYIINSLLGHLPLVGRLFSPEAGGGLFSAAFTASGPISDPSININPLSAVTPGFLRGLFDLDDEDAPQR
ncbi:YhdP family protein [Sabulicella glaciei]|uniref:DUF3971 domain-containing protein n=1 Tax=Sabulicella glaciei TaxID=2984948 RepID=A0ABT3P279_9PROT|nr:DUF3971 domain-containing protein [Roseococcus sp. MDT2-1-1]MCW8088511.1 DUF3971 domain-containing protein [Roseococcus sp. MDT2-1-1]